MEEVVYSTCARSGIADHSVFHHFKSIYFMNPIDWIVLFGTIGLIVVYGYYKTRKQQSLEDYFRGGNSFSWSTIGLSVMATQASAITFLSTPGQAYESGMGFVQFYFGLPLAMIVISIFFIPVYYRLKVYTAYEFLENRFDRKTRLLTAGLFLIQRGLATGITIYAPSIILSTILSWPLFITNLIIGSLVILYTVSGGSKAVGQTQKQQMFVIFLGLFVVFGVLLWKMPEGVGFMDTLQVAGTFEKMNIIDFKFDLNNRYNVFSGIIGGFFLMLSYFGTDQSQVQRYLTGKNMAASRLGLMMNGLIKIPMQFFILLIGVMVFVFYIFNTPPMFFNKAAASQVMESSYGNEWQSLQEEYKETHALKQEEVNKLLQDNGSPEVAFNLYQQELNIRNEAKTVMQKVNANLETEDTDYVFITFVMEHLPVGIVGLLLAMIFSGAMSSTSSELNALASTTMVDYVKMFTRKEMDDVRISKWITFTWGVIAILFATFANLFDNLIEAINILGSLFYGTILGVFLVAFFIRFVKGNAVFVAALISEAIVFYLFYFTDLGYLLFNFVGCGLVIVIAMVLQWLWPSGK